MGGSSEDGGQRKRNRAVVDALSGAIAGCVSRFVVGPLDVVKIRMQVQIEPVASTSSAMAGPSKYTGIWQALRTIAREEGIQGLWRGTVPAQLLTVPYCAVQFVALQQIKQAALDWGFTKQGSSPPPFVSFGSGAFAGMCATVASYPFDLLRTRLAAQGRPPVYAGMTDAARKIWAQGGVGALYSGLGVTLLEIIPYAAIQFGTYDVLNQQWTAASHAVARQRGLDPPPKPTFTQQFICGLTAGMVARLASHPLDVAKKRYQVAGLQRSLQYGARVDTEICHRTLANVLRQIAQKEGLQGLYKGVTPSLAKAAPASAVTFAVYEMIVKHLHDE